MLDPNLLEQLSDPDPEQRKRAIRAFVANNDYEAMEYLKNVYYTDDDPDVREEARLAGIELRTEHNPTGFEGVPRPTQSTGGAMSPLPSVAKHSVLEEKNRNYSELTWQDTVLHVMALGTVLAVGLYILLTSLTGLFDEVILEMRQDIVNNPNSTTFTLNDIDTLEEFLDQTGSGGGGILIALIGGAGSILAFIIECYIINHLAISSYNGRGGFYEFMREFAIANAVSWAVFYVLIIIILQQIGSALSDINSISSSGNGILSIAPCGFVFVIIGIVYYLSRVISKSYQIKGWHGFIALMVGFVASQIALSMLQFCAAPFIG